MGLQANNQSQGLGTIKPMITADAKKLQRKKTDVVRKVEYIL